MTYKINPNIEKLRNQIDECDKKIISYLHKRIKVVNKIGALKNKNKLNIYAPQRELSVIKKILNYNNNIFPQKSLLKIYNEIFSVSRKLQQELKIGYLGPEGTFTHIASENIFGTQSKYVPLNSIRDIFTELDTEQINYGVVPIENSNEGIVGFTLDMLTEYNHSIIQEFFIEISHNIISRENSIEKLKTLYSHPQPIGQCRTFIENNLKNVKIIETFSTAEAARLASMKRYSSAISSKKAAEKYNLNILSEKINDNQNNFTRFIVISRNPNKIKNKALYKSSAIIGVKDKPGALFSILKPFSKYKINLTKIESRPTKKKAWEYIFFIEFIGNPLTNKIKNAFKELEHSSTYCKDLGYYPIFQHKV